MGLESMDTWREQRLRLEARRASLKRAAEQDSRQPTLFERAGLSAAEEARRAPPTREEWDRMARIAKVLVRGCLGNRCIQELIADPAWPAYTVESCTEAPTVRIEYDQAYAIADLGSGLSATKHKSWGDGPRVMPLSLDDPVDPMFVLYVFRDGSRYNAKYEQRRELKARLGAAHRGLVNEARKFTFADYEFSLKAEKRAVILGVLGMTAAEFWRAVNGVDRIDRVYRQSTLSINE
jgi:hypothetical protein